MKLNLKRITESLYYLFIMGAVIFILAYLVARPVPKAVVAETMPVEIIDLCADVQEDIFIEINDEVPEVPETVPQEPVKYADVPMSEELQDHLMEVCEDNGIEYEFALATIKHESEFKENAKHENSNGSTDRGMCQVNSCWTKTFKQMGFIECTEDLYDPMKNIDCGMYVLGQAVEKYGNTERAYAYYNTGRTSVKSNASSRQVWKYRNEFKEELK